MTQEEKKKRIIELTTELNTASEAFYNGKGELLSNDEWDTYFEELSLLEKETGFSLPDSPVSHLPLPGQANNKSENDNLVYTSKKNIPSKPSVLYSLKDYLVDDSFKISSNIHVKCNNCGRNYIFDKDYYNVEENSSEANMGLRKEHIYKWHELCRSCKAPIACSISVTEYPIGTIEGAPSLRLSGCSITDKKPIRLDFNDYYNIVHAPSLSSYLIKKNTPQRISGIETVIHNGIAYLCNDEQAPFIKDNLLSLSFWDPKAQKFSLLSILVSETNTISFSENGAYIAQAFDLMRPTNSTMKLLGRVAEAVLVRHCENDENYNKIWLAIARKHKTNINHSSKFKAIGTGLHSTERFYNALYDPNAPQRDIIWINQDGEVESVYSPNRTTARTQAGLQLKTTFYPKDYIFPALKTKKYIVPVIAFPLSGDKDYNKLLDAVKGYNLINTRDPIIIGKDIINAKDIDKEAYKSLKDYFPLIRDLIIRRISASDFVKEAMTEPALQDAALKTVLSGCSSKVFLA